MDDAKTPQPISKDSAAPAPGGDGKAPPAPKLPKEIGGAPGPEPTRYGDWQHKGRVSDF